MSPSLTADKVPAWCSEQLPKAVDFLEGLVNQNSFTLNPDGVNLVQERYGAELQKLGLEIEFRPMAERGNVMIATTRACRDSDRRILLVGHADTVHPPESSFQRLTRQGDKLTGPGTVDMKAGLVVMSLALQALNNLGVLHKLPIEVVNNCAEEDSTAETRAFMTSVAEKARAALVFEFQRPGGKVVTSRFGIGMYTLNVTGKAAHAGNALLDGASAVEQLADFIPRINALRDVPNNITANVGKISGGSATNVVPDSAACEFEMRAARASDIANLEAQVRAFSVRVPGTSFELKVQKVISPLEESDASRALFEAYSQAAARTGAKLEISPRVAGLSDANNLGQLGLPVIDAVGAAGAGAHTKDEYALASSIAAKAAQLVYFLLDQPECQASRAS